jgi:hypothetical protein
LLRGSPDDKWRHKTRRPEVTVIKQERVVLLANENWRKSCRTRHYRDVSTVPESLGPTASKSFRAIDTCAPHIPWGTETQSEFMSADTFLLLSDSTDFEEMWRQDYECKMWSLTIRAEQIQGV